MDFSQKEAMGLIVAIICISMILAGLYNIGFFNRMEAFIKATTQSDVVEVVEPNSEGT